MDFIKKSIALAMMAMVWLGCAEETPFKSKEEVIKEVNDIKNSRNPFHDIRNVVAIMNNDIYYFSRLDSVPRRITFTPDREKTDVRLSPDHTLIAYENEDYYPEIIRADDGTLVEALPDYKYFTQMDWMKDRNTLYVLYNQDVYFWGTPAGSFEQVGFLWDYVISFSMNSIGDKVYYVQPSEGGSVHMYYTSESQGIKMQEPDGIDADLFDYVDFYDNTGSFMLGNRRYSDSRTMERIVCIQRDKFMKAYEWSKDDMNTPQFNAKNEVLLFGFVEYGVYSIKAVYLGTEFYTPRFVDDRMEYLVEGYTSDDPIDIDWVP
jgi:hypothetical protein